MVCLSAIAVHDSARTGRMGLRRALLSRRANLGDCSDARSVFHHILVPGQLRYPVCVVPLPGRGRASAADLGVRVGKASLACADNVLPDDFGGLIYCHATPDDCGAYSTAARLQHDLDLKGACAFSLSQAHNSALLIALDLAAALVEGPEQTGAVMLVASDKLLFGAAPHVARRMVWGDVAAAAVVTREATAGWRLASICLRQFATPWRAHQSWPDDARLAFARFGAATLAACAADAGLDLEQLDAVLTTSPDADLVRAVHGAAGIDTLAGLFISEPSGARRHLASCADLLLGLARLEQSMAAGQHVLAWCQGDNGEFACAILKRLA